MKNKFEKGRFTILIFPALSESGLTFSSRFKVPSNSLIETDNLIIKYFYPERIRGHGERDERFMLTYGDFETIIS